MSPPSHRRPSGSGTVGRAQRVALLVVVAAVLVGSGLAAYLVTPPAAPVAPAVGPVSFAAPVGSESSEWYCTGGPGTDGTAGVTIYLANAGTKAVTGSLYVTDSTGTTGVASVTVPAGGQTTVDPAAFAPGPWLATRFDLDGGGVTATELVDGSYGWSMAPCAAVTSSTWYFASGATTTGSTMYVSVYNPAATTAVVDLTFLTPSGAVQPRPFEGLVVPPGAVVVAEVASYVQDQASVSTIVQARSGAVVAAVLQEYSSGSTSGLSLRLGATAPQSRWAFPRSVDVTGGRTAFVVFNPGSTDEQVTVSTRIASGPLAPFTVSVPAGSTSSVVTSTATRVPANVDYSTMISAAGGPGVVVDRTAMSSTAGAVPQWGAVSAVGAGPAFSADRRWLVANPAKPATPPVSGAAPFALALANTGRAAVSAQVTALGGPGGGQRLAKVVIPAGAFAVLEPTVLARAGARPLDVTSSGPLAVLGDGTPAGMPGVVGLPATSLPG